MESIPNVEYKIVLLRPIDEALQLSLLNCREEKVTVLRLSQCKKPVVSYIVQGGGHRWFGSSFKTGYIRNEAITKFFGGTSRLLLIFLILIKNQSLYYEA